MSPNSLAMLEAVPYFEKQITYPCAKYKARKALFQCSGVLYGWHSVFSRSALKEIGVESKVICSKAHFLRLKQLNSYK